MYSGPSLPWLEEKAFPGIKRFQSRIASLANRPGITSKNTLASGIERNRLFAFLLLALTLVG